MKLQFPNVRRTDFLETTPSLRSTWTFKVSSYAVILHACISTLWLLIFWRELPPRVPLWYSRPWGTDRLVPPIYLCIPIGASILLYAINIFIANKLSLDHPIFARVLFLSSALVSIMSTIVIIRIIALMT